MKRLFLLTTMLVLMCAMAINAIENLPQTEDPNARKNPVTDILDWPEGAVQQSNLYNNWAGQPLGPRGDLDGYSNWPPAILDFSFAGYRQGNTPIPKIVTTRTINVTDYGAIPNDGKDDTQAIRDCFADVTDGTMVLFPPGEFIVFKDEGGTHLEIASASNVIIQGSGAQGVRDGGTTIYQGHPQIKYDDDGNSESFRSGGIFRMAKKSGSAVHSNLSDTHTFTLQKINYLNVDNPERFIGKKFVKLGVKNGYTVNPHDDADDNVYVDGILNVDTPKLYHWKHNMGIWRYDEMPPSWETINTGLHLHEFHEIDHVDTVRNRIYLKTPVMNSYSRANHQVSSKEYNEDVGFQDLHFDCGYNVPWDHDKKERQGYYGRNAINMSGLANSWVKRVRISNSTSGIEYGGTCNISIIGVVFDGNAGHYSIVGAGASHAFIGLIQEYDDKAHHGISVQGGTSGIVMWGIGGPDQTMHGPDAHGWQPTYTLMDNYYSDSHQASGVAYDNRPNHLLGYIRYNNRATSSVNTFDGMEWSQINIPWSADNWDAFWSSVKTAAKMIEKGNLTFHQTGGFQTMQGIISGFKSGANPVDWEYVEGWNNYVSPKSLYVAQLTHRHDGIEPFWVEQEIGEYDEWFDIVMNGETPPSGYIITENTDPVFSEDSKTFSIAEHAENAIEGAEKDRINALSDLNDNGNQLIDDPFGDPVTATDTTNYVLRYTLQDADGMFTVDTYTGQLQLAGRLDYETATSHTFTLKADDFFDGEDTIEITVNVLNIPERHAPTFDGDNNDQMSIAENLPIGTNIGSPITAEVIGNETITYSIIGSYTTHKANEMFTVDSATGQIKSKIIFDYEALPAGNTGYGGIVQATGASGLNSYESHNFFITILDRPDFPERSKVLSVNSNAERRDPIGEPITAAYTESVRYTLSGDDADSFSVGRRSGQISLDTTLNMAVKIQYAVILTASSDGFSDEIDITINVIEVIDDNIEYSVRENTPTGVTIGNLSTLPIPIGTFTAPLSYVLSGSDQPSFSINATGELKTGDPLDFEHRTTYSVVVTISDGINSRDYNVAINVTNVNEKPVISGDRYRTYTIKENLKVGKKISPMLRVNDPDGDDITYSLKGSDEIFIANNKGQIVVDGEVDYETKTAYRGMHLIASDGNLTDKLTVAVTIIDVNEKPEFAENSSTTLTVAENLPIGIQFGRPYVAIDPEGQTVTYQLRGSGSRHFALNSDTNKLETREIFDYEDKSLYNLKVRALTESGPNETIDVRVFITDKEERPAGTQLLNNFPNPFNPETWIPYQLVKPSNVSITIFNSRGSVVRELNLGIKSAGYYLGRNNAAHWDGRNTFGERVSSGVYYYHFRSNTLSEMKKMVILK